MSKRASQRTGPCNMYIHHFVSPFQPIYSSTHSNWQKVGAEHNTDRVTIHHLNRCFHSNVTKTNKTLFPTKAYSTSILRVR
jgi:hypothetical protein